MAIARIMAIVRKMLLATIFMLLLIPAVRSAPILSGPSPQNYGYIYGKDTDIFSVNITDSALDAASAILKARVDDPTSVWATKAMDCYSLGGDKWVCNTTLPGLSALVNDGNWLLYFFNVSNTTSSYGNLGNETDPLRVRVDRSAPSITFIVPANESYSSGKLRIKMEVKDTYSGLNYSTVNYSFDNSSWFSTTVSDSYFTALVDWDTANYQNNQTIPLYGKASDMLANIKYVKIQTIVDNEKPQLSIIEPKTYQMITTNTLINITATDVYSGIDTGNVKFSAGSASDTLSCTGTLYSSSCTATLVPNFIEDGNQTLVVTVADRAGNSVSASVPILIDNLPPTIQITSPSVAAVVKSNLQISASVSDKGVGVENASFRWETGSVAGSWNPLVCQGDPKSYTCSVLWNTKSVVDGTYTIRIMAYDKIGKQATAGVQIGISNGILGNQTGLPITTTTTSSTTTTLIEQPSSFIFNISSVVEFVINGKENIWLVIIALGAIIIILFGIYSAYKSASQH